VSDAPREAARHFESVADLRRRVQLPVRKYNDVAGLLVGDRVSIHVTRAFVHLRWSPTVATLAMLVFGIVGSVLTLFGGVTAIAGFACVFVYYVCDCVDGEVARYHRREKLIWGFHDFLFHLYVKAAFFVCLGVYAVRASGQPVLFAFALAALLATLFQKFLNDIPIVLAAPHVLLRRPHEREHFVEQIAPRGTIEDDADDGALPDDHTPFELGRPLTVLRAALTNFDLSVLFFLVASIGDLFVEPWLVGAATFDLKILLLCWYGVVLPLDFVDRVQTHVRRGHFYGDARRLLRGADKFRLPR
jgi:hypothetical protein